MFKNASTSIDGCEYDLKNKKIIDDSLGEENNIEKATQLKQTFEEQLNIRIDDLEHIKDNLN